jgi:hypothetical protein
MRTLLFAGVAAALVVGVAQAAETPDPREAARVRQTILAISTNSDLGAFDAVAPLFAETVVVDYTSLWGGEPQDFTPDALMGAWKGVLPGFDATWHEIGDLTISVQGETAVVASTIDARHWIGARTWRLIGRYTFELRKVDRRWRVTRMTLVVTEERGDRVLATEARVRASGRRVR